MYPDPDDANLKHSHFACTIPAWAAATRIGRAYARARVRRIVARELSEKGYELTGQLCIHFGMVDSKAMAIAHFTSRDALAAAYADKGAER